MTFNSSSELDISQRFGTNVSNRQILNVKRLRSPLATIKKVFNVKLAARFHPPLRIGLTLVVYEKNPQTISQIKILSYIIYVML